MFLSIIIPVFNCEKYIEECLLSIINQDIREDDYEIICINDGSSDSSRDIVLGYTTRFTNLIYKEQSNKGVSAARNLGMKFARGDYIWFIDADDFIAPFCFSELLTCVNKYDYDRIQVDSYVFIDSLSVSEKNLLQEGFLKSNYPYKDVMATRTLYKRQYLQNNSISFLEGVDYGEDGVFNYQTLIHSPKTCKSNVLAYFYRKRKDSLTGQPREQAVKKCLSGTPKIFDIIVKDFNDRVDIIQSRRMLVYWMYAVIDEYSIVDKDSFLCFEWNYRLIIPFEDFELKKLDKQLKRFARYHNYNELLFWAKKYRKKKQNAEKKKKMIKKIEGYLKHPKRIRKLIVKY